MRAGGCATSLALILAGCTAGPNYRPSMPADLGVPDRFIGAPTEASPSDIRTWWDRFEDPVLSGLLTRALADNLDIAQAAARLRQAREALVQARSQQRPEMGASGSAGRNLNAGIPDNSAFSGRIDAQWSADLFGGLRRNAEASRASLDASGYALANVRTAIAAEVARNYVDACVLRVQLAIARDTLKTQSDNLEIAGFRVQAGLASSLDVEQARAQRAQTAASIPSLTRSEAAALNRLSILTARAPGAVDALFAGIPNIPQAPLALAIGIPADTLRQRPDVRAAERNLAAATARIGVAQAQLYPTLSLSGDIGANATSIRTLTDFVTGGVFASLAQTIFDGGRLRSVVRQSRAQAEESFAAYKSTILIALEDIENALVARDAAIARVAELRIQIDASNAAAILARSNYRAGLSDFRTLLDAERTLLAARDGLASAEGDRASALIQLYLALGGGWTSAEPLPAR